jgi:predicted transglutaminase-like cysteine proteinase
LFCFSLFSLFVTSLLSFSQAYDKRLASLPKSASAADSARSTDAMAYGASAASGSGSKAAAGGVQDAPAALDRMAGELAAKAARNATFSRRRAELDGADVDHINSRNAHFNKKIKRAYDKYTVEIKQNLERGTAL